MVKYKVLIAHQSTIPHYRIDFYNALMKLKPNSWNFDVVYDVEESAKKRFFKEDIDASLFSFNTLNTKSFFYNNGNSYVAFQDFVFKTRGYDLIIVEQAFNNLSYPMVQMLRLFGKKVALWGHGRHMSAINPSISKKVMEWSKAKLMTLSDGFFGYTTETKDYLLNSGYDPYKIFVLNNTIDIQKQRTYYSRFIEKREEVKSQYRLHGKKVLLFVGRFNHTKRLDFLIGAVNKLVEKDPSYILFIVGNGKNSNLQELHESENIRFLGSITDLEILAPIYCMSDLFVFPGQVGLGPLQAMCFDLPILTVDSPRHMPEFVYLNNQNSISMKNGTTCEEYCNEINRVFISETLNSLKSNIWNSISHLTIDNMAKNMINGVNQILRINDSDR